MTLQILIAKNRKGRVPKMPLKQCDQMAKLLLNLRPFTTMKICPIAYKISKAGTNVYQLLKNYTENCPKTFKIMPKGWNFAKTGHTDWYLGRHRWKQSCSLYRPISLNTNVFCKKWAKPGLFFIYFWSFQTNDRYNFYNKSMWKNV